MQNRIEIRAYPVTYDPDTFSHCERGTNPSGNLGAREGDWQGRQSQPWDIYLYIRGLIGKRVMIHTLSTLEGPSSHAGAAQNGIFTGVVETVLSEGVIIHSEQGRVLIYNWAIVAIESP